MSERRKSVDLVIPLFIAVMVLGLGFGGGVLLGWTTRDRPPIPQDTGAAWFPRPFGRAQLLRETNEPGHTAVDTTFRSLRFAQERAYVARSFRHTAS